MVMENDNELLHCILLFVVFCSLKGVGTVPYCTIILYKLFLTISLKKILIYILICWFWRKLSIVCLITILTFTKTDIFKWKKSNRKKVLLNTKFHSKKTFEKKKIQRTFRWHKTMPTNMKRNANVS